MYRDRYDGCECVLAGCWRLSPVWLVGWISCDGIIRKKKEPRK